MLLLVVVLLNLALFTDCDPIPDPKIPDIHMHIYLPKDKGNVAGGSDYSICGEVDCDERRRKRSPGSSEDEVDVQCCGWGSDYSSPAEKHHKHGNKESEKGDDTHKDGNDYSLRPVKRNRPYVPVKGSDYSICGEVDCEARRHKRSAGAQEDLVDVKCCGWSGSDYSSPAKKSFKHGSDNSSPAKKKSKHGRDYSICGEVDCDERRRKRSPGEEPEDLVDVQCCGWGK